MSKIGKRPITIPDGVTVTIHPDAIECKGPLGVGRVPRLPFVAAESDSKTIAFSLQGNSKQAKANWGTLRSLTQSAISGVLNGFKKTLLIEGVGYRAVMEGPALILHIGYSHPVRFEPPADVAISVARNAISISGINKGAVGQVAAKIRALKKPEPYKGKGIRYENEVIRRKAGKKTAGATK